MLLWELKKFLNRNTIIFLITMVVFNFFCVFVVEYEHMTPEGRFIQEKQSRLFWSYAETPEDFDKAYSSYKRKLSDYEKMLRAAPYVGGEITSWENVIIDLPNYGDRDLYNDVMNTISSIENYNTDIELILSKAYSELNDIGEIRRGEYEYEYQIQLILHYEKLKSLHMEVVPVRGWDTLFSLQSPLILLTITVICLSPQCFLMEKSTKFLPVLTTTRKGRFVTSASKIMRVLIYSSCSAVLFSVTPMFIISCSTGFSSPDQYIQAIELFRLCPYELTIAQYFIITLLHRILMAFTISIFTILVSKVFGSYILSICIISLYMVFSIAVYGTEKHILSYFAIADTAYVFERFRALNVLGGFIQLISYIIVSTLLSAALFILLILLIPTNIKEYRFFEKITSCLTQGTHFSLQTYQTHIHKLFYWESVKMIFTGSRVLVLICFIIIRFAVQANYFAPSMIIDEVQYRLYINDLQTLGGIMNSDSDSYIEKEQEYINSSYANYFTALDQIKDNLITPEEMHQHNMRYNYALAVSPALTRLQTQRNYLLNQSQFTNNLGYVNADGIMKILSPKPDVIYVLILLFLLPPSFAHEYSSSFYTLIKTTKNGLKQTWVSKYVSLICFFAMLYALFIAMDFYLLSQNYGLYDLKFSIQSIQEFASIENSTSIGHYLLLSKLTGLLGCELIVIIFIGLSSICKSTPVCISVLFVVCFLPDIFPLFNIDFLNTLSITDIIHPLYGINTFTLLFLLIAAIICTVRSYHAWNNEMIISGRIEVSPTLENYYRYIFGDVVSAN